MISKELFEKVVGYKVNSVAFENGLIYYDDYGHIEKEINIYELAQKCKEWAFGKGYEIVVLSHSIKIYRNLFEVYFINTDLYDISKFFEACQWVLENTKND